MSKHGSARAVFAGAAIAATLALAGCGGVPKGTKPDVPGENAGGTGAAAATSRLSGTASLTTRPNTAQGAAAAKSFAKANSIPFPVAVGNTWTYQTRAGGETGRTTNKIVAAGPGSGGYRVTVSSTTSVGGSASTVVPVYTFYPNGTIGYPVPPVSTGPVKTEVVIRAPGGTGLTTSELLSFTKATSVIGDGS